jgi:hypothetical protein
MTAPPALLSFAIRIGFWIQIRIRSRTLILCQFTNFVYFLISHTRLRLLSYLPHSSQCPFNPHNTTSQNNSINSYLGIFSKAKISDQRLKKHRHGYMGMQDFIGKKQQKETERKTQYMYVCMYEYAVFTKYGTVYLV